MGKSNNDSKISQRPKKSFLLLVVIMSLIVVFSLGFLPIISLGLFSIVSSIFKMKIDPTISVSVSFVWMPILGMLIGIIIGLRIVFRK